MNTFLDDGGSDIGLNGIFVCGAIVSGFFVYSGKHKASLRVREKKRNLRERKRKNI